MAKEEKFPGWFLWLWNYFPILVVSGVVVGAIVIGGMVFMENRLSEIEDQINYAPPRSYVAPNLDDYHADEMTIERLTNRHVVYVPAYSHIYYQGGSAYSLETTLSIRNVDTREPIYVEAVEYYNTNGELAKTQVDRLIKLEPLQTIEFLIERRDSTGGSGANFLVRWGSTSDVDNALVESVMVGVAGTQGISFGRTGIEVTPNDTIKNK